MSPLLLLLFEVGDEEGEEEVLLGDTAGDGDDDDGAGSGDARLEAAGWPEPQFRGTMIFTIIMSVVVRVGRAETCSGAMMMDAARPFVARMALSVICIFD